MSANRAAKNARRAARAARAAALAGPGPADEARPTAVADPLAAHAAVPHAPPAAAADVTPAAAVTPAVAETPAALPAAPVPPSPAEALAAETPAAAPVPTPASNVTPAAAVTPALTPAAADPAAPPTAAAAAGLGLASVYNVPEEARLAVAAATHIKDLDKPTRMRLYNAVDRAMKAKDFPAEIVAKWSAAAVDSRRQGGVVRLRMLQAFVADPSCATMVAQESLTQESEDWRRTTWTLRSRDDLEKEWQHLEPERRREKVDKLVATARAQQVHPQTGEELYEVLETMQLGTAGCDRKVAALNVHAGVGSGAVAQQFVDHLEPPPAADLKMLHDKPAEAAAKKTKKVAAAKKNVAAKPKPFVHPATKLAAQMGKKMAAATQLRADIELAAAGNTADRHTAQVLEVLEGIVSKGDGLQAELTTAIRAARGAVDDSTWPVLKEEADGYMREVDAEVKFARTRLMVLRGRKA